MISFITTEIYRVGNLLDMHIIHSIQWKFGLNS